MSGQIGFVLSVYCTVAIAGITTESEGAGGEAVEAVRTGALAGE